MTGTPINEIPSIQTGVEHQKGPFTCTTVFTENVWAEWAGFPHRALRFTADILELT